MRTLLLVLTSILSALLATGVEIVDLPSVETANNSAVVHWHTDVSAGTRVQISPSAKILPGDKTPDTDHTATVTALKPGVKYTVVVGTARVWLATNEFTTADTTATTSPEKVAAAPPGKTTSATAPPTRKIWVNLPSLPDHFAQILAQTIPTITRTRPGKFYNAPRRKACPPRWTTAYPLRPQSQVAA